MNFFFTISDDLLSCKLTIPRFQNRGIFDYNQILYSASIFNNAWVVKKIISNENNSFYTVKKSAGFIQSDPIFFLYDKDHIDSAALKQLNFSNNFTKTDPAFRANLRVQNKLGGFSSYQSEYPLSMIKKNGSIISQISSLANKKADKNFLYFRNIYFKPVVKPFKVYILDIIKRKILYTQIFYTNTLNKMEIEKKVISPSNFFFSDDYLGIPVYYSENNAHISLEHTHPPHSYILSQNKYEIVSNLKDYAKKIIIEQN